MNKFMKMAIEEAKKGIDLGHGGPFGSVIVKDGKVVSKGHNPRFSTGLRPFGVLTHVESVVCLERKEK